MPAFKVDPIYATGHISCNAVHPQYAKIPGLELLVRFEGTRRKNVRVAVTFGDVRSRRGLWFSLRVNGAEVFSARQRGTHSSIHLERVVELDPNEEYRFEVYWTAASQRGAGSISALAGQLHMSVIVVDDVRRFERV